MKPLFRFQSDYRTHICTYVSYPDGEIVINSNGRIGRYLFFPSDIVKYYNGKLPSELTIIDVACGAAADHPFVMDYLKDIKLNLIGVDINHGTLHYTVNGEVSYPVNNTFAIDQKGLLCNRGYAFIPNGRTFKDAGLYKVSKYFEKCNRDANNVIHLDSTHNMFEDRWIMKPEYRKKLNLIVADATELPFPNNIADVVIAANFLFGSNVSVARRINAEIDRILKPDGLYLGDRRNITHKN
jgi:SAM-dependent methyltransferase